MVETSCVYTPDKHELNFSFVMNEIDVQMVLFSILLIMLDNKRIVIKYCTKMRHVNAMSFWSSIGTTSDNISNIPNNISNSSNMSDMINDTCNAIEFHIDNLVDNEYRRIIEETNTNSTKFKTNSNVSHDSDAELITCMIAVKDIYHIDEFYEGDASFALMYLC